MPYNPGEILLDKYRIEELIGQGAFAEVYRVTHVKLNVTRAVKILSRETPGVGSTEFKEFLARFQLEAQLGAMINTPAPHPNLLQVHDFQQKGELLLLEMEYAAGGNLADRIARTRERGESIPVEEAVQIATDIAEGLAAIHAGDIVHRDLKPSNILFDRDGGAKIADLGLAQIPGGPSMRSRISQPMPHPGTPGYMSPEQKDERDYLKPSSDVYALGLILFEMLTGRFYRNVRPDTRVSDLHADVPKWLDRLVADMLQVDAGKRPWDGAEVEKLLKSQGKTDGTQPKPLGIQALITSMISRLPRWGFVFIGILLLVILLVGSLLIWQDDQNGSVDTPEPTLTQAMALVTSTSPQKNQTPSIQPTDTIAVVTETSSPSPTPTLSPTSTWMQGKLAFVARYKNGTALYTMDLAAEPEPRLLHAPSSDALLLAPSWSPDFSRIAFHTYGGSLQVIVLQGGSGTRNLYPCSGASWFPEGNHIICAANGQSKFAIVDSNSGSLDESVSVEKGAVLPCRSPSREEIVYSQFEGDQTSIWRLSLDSNLPTLLAGEASENYAPNFSPDGDWIAYQSTLGSPLSEIWVMDRNGDQARRITNTPGGHWSRAPSWSPDGDWLAYVSDQNESIGADYGEIYAISLESGETIQITNTGGKIYDWRVAWGK